MTDMNTYHARKSRVTTHDAIRIDDKLDKRKWNQKDAKINLASLLNDPRKAKRDYDLFTKTWGENFKDIPKSFIPKSIRVPNIYLEHFVEYLDQTKDKFIRHTSQQLCNDCNGEVEVSLANTNLSNNMDSAFIQQKRIQEITRSALESLPKMFLRPDFALEQPDTFAKVLSFSCTSTQTSLVAKNNHFHKDEQPFHHVTSSKLLQEQLSHYLDLVEVAIVRQISVQSDAFFNAMSSHDILHDYLSKLHILTQHMRQKLSVIKRSISSKSLLVIKLHKQRDKHKMVLEKLVTMVTIHQAQPTIQLLLSTAEYSSALDLINTTQEVLTQEMKGIHCFRHLGSQLTEMGGAIIQMMLKEVADYIREDLQRPIEETDTTSHNKFSALIFGLLRQRRLEFLEDFQDEVQETVRYLIKETVLEIVETIENVTKLLREESDMAQNNSGSSEEDKTDGKLDVNEKNLAERMRELTFDDWITLLRKIFKSLSVILRRIKLLLCAVEKTARNLCPALQIDETDRNECKEIKRQHSFRQNSQNVLSPEINESNTEEGLWDDLDAYEASLMNQVDEMPSETNHNHNTEASQTNSTLPSQHEPSDEASSSDNLNPIVALMQSEYEEVCLHLQEKYQWAVEYQNDRCVKVIIARGKHGSFDKLAASEFLTLAQTVEEYLRTCEEVSNDEEDESGGLFHMESIGMSLKDIIKSHSSMFINRFHNERKNKLSLILDNESWKQAEVPSELSYLLNAMSDGNLSSSTKDLKPVTIGSNNSRDSSVLILGGRKYAVVGTVLLLLKIVSEYCRCADDIPSSSAELVTRLAELLTIFNSRTCQLVLGAGALKMAGLKMITTRNLALASCSLQLVLHFIPTVNLNFEEKLKKFNSNLNILRRFEHCAKDYKDHISEIDNKLIAIMESVLDSSLDKWEVKAPVPSHQIRTICKQITKLFSTIDGLLSEQHCNRIITQIHSKFKMRLRHKLKRFNIQNDGGPRHGLVMSDVAFYEGSMKNLRGFSSMDFKMQSVWT